jgi:hypothetical protein
MAAPDVPAAPKPAADPVADAVKADPVAVQAGVDKAVADAAKAAADARSAEAKAVKDERDAAETGSAAAQLERAAKARQATAEADKAAAAAQRDQIAAFIPDFSKVERGNLDLKGEKPLFAEPLAQRALDSAATSLAAAASRVLDKGQWRILVTSDAELATSHAAYLDVVTGLDQLTAAADKLLGELSDTSTLEFAPLGPALSALAGALPGLLSLFAAHRTVTSAAVSIDDLAAAAATAGAFTRLKDAGAVVHDDVRLLSTGGVHRRLATLSDRGQQLVGQRIALEAAVASAQARLELARAKVDDALKALEKTTADEEPAKRKALDQAREALGPLEQELSAATVKLGLVQSVKSAIDAFITSLTAVGAGTRSPLTLAAMRERLHDVEDPAAAEGDAPADDGRFTHVLLVKGNGGAAMQLVEDKPLWSDDTFAVVATAGITYMLIETGESRVLAAGNVGGSVEAHGTLGERIDVQVDADPFDKPPEAADVFAGEMP